MYKYTHESFTTGQLVYPSEIKEIKSKEDMRRWFEWRGQFENGIDDTGDNDFQSLTRKTNNLPGHLEYLPDGYVIKYISFPRCKTASRAVFYENECSRISTN